MLVRRGFGSVRVEVTLEGVTWRTSVFPSKETGGYFLPVKMEVLRKNRYCRRRRGYGRAGIARSLAVVVCLRSDAVRSNRSAICSSTIGAFAAVECVGQAAAAVGLLRQRLALLLGNIDQHVHRSGERAVIVEQRSRVGTEGEAAAVGPLGDGDGIADGALLRIACAIGQSSCGRRSPMVV